LKGDVKMTRKKKNVENVSRRVCVKWIKDKKIDRYRVMCYVNNKKYAETTIEHKPRHARIRKSIEARLKWLALLKYHTSAK